jgi:hypothetical protein
MKNIFLAILISISICACTAVPEAVTPITQPQSASNDADRLSTLAAVRAELEAMHHSDQKVREGYKIGMDQKELRGYLEKLEIVDTANQLRLDEIVKQHGWPETKDVGTKAVRGAFLVVQHAPQQYKKRYFTMVQKAMERGDLPKSEFAKLDDRVRMNDGQPQRYGTQITDIAGIRTFWQIEDEANVDKRRAEIGLEPMAELARRSNVQYIPYAERRAQEAKAKTEAKK